MEDVTRARILAESRRSISKLQLLATFFQDEVLYGILLRTQVIHNLYEGSAALDAGRLELFHIQYTASILELLRKVRAANEKLVAALYEEIDLHRALEERLRHSSTDAADIRSAAEKQARRLALSLRKLYQLLSEGGDAYPFSTDLSAFSARYGPGFFDAVPDAVLERLLAYAPAEVYATEHVTIHRRLLGLLHKYSFDIQFYDGLKAGTVVAEIYRLKPAEVSFAFVPVRNLLLLVDPAESPAIDGLLARPRGAAFVQTVHEKVKLLQSRVGDYKTHLPETIRPLLAEYLQKIEDPTFLQDSKDFDVYANILKTMLSTDAL